ncbi:MAG: 1-acyl-sn-glycerol-3-phosphate acyltransferase, partial [Bacteroidetes bacterium]|nr:1-acyl-sn-glycerol-3-phosphate acyltransferase [Bacteroidota bacterium]
MFYNFMQLWVRMALFVFFKKIKTTDDGILKLKGPMILASNHPNSFLDAIVLGAIYKTPVHYLVRGDAFKKPLMRKFFTAIKMLPIYRMSEGRENLKNNDETFEKCSVILKQKGIVLIFSEGLCINEWVLRPLKKGTARIALQGFNDDKIGSELSILPVGLNYNHFDRWGKSLQINWGDKIYIQNQKNTGITGAAIGEFNQDLTNQLSQLVL